MINELYGVDSYHPNEAVIAPYSVFTYQKSGPLDLNSHNFENFNLVTVKLDKLRCNLQEDEAFWMENKADIEKNYS